MNFFKYTASALLIIASLSSCSDEPKAPEVKGNPVMTIKSEITAAHFGDNINFVVNCSDASIPLSTLKATLYFGEEPVAQTVIRTKENGADYEGTLSVPFLANIPDGTASLVFTLQNICFAVNEIELPVAVSRPDYPYVTLVSTDGDNTVEYRLDRVDKNVYELTDQLPQKVRGFIHTPAVDANGQELVLGMKNGQIVVGGDVAIPFANPTSGIYTLSFNSFNFTAAPNVCFIIDGEELDGIDNNSAGVILSLTKDQMLKVEIPDFDTWGINEDFFSRNPDGSLTFVPNGGTYKLVANTKFRYLNAYKVSGEAPATMTGTGLGACWALGTGIGKPSYAENEVGTNSGKALCLASSESKVYDITFVAGKTINPAGFAIKFAGSPEKDVLTGTYYKVVNSDLIEKAADGTITLAPGATLTDGATYRFTLDLTKGKRNITINFGEVK